jgi:hypothetical protein
MGRRVVAVVASLLLAAFFAFFGYFKTFAPLDVLAQHHAWTTALPEWLGRLVGVTELASAATLLAGTALPRMRGAARLAAAYLVLNQGAAALVHLARSESSALPQNGVIVALALIASAAIQTRQPREKTS